MVINDREYAFGGHGKRSITGVYYTTPNYEPPGGTFRLSVLQGFTFRTEQEIQQIIKDVSNKFLGPSYNLLTYNCNHFTSALCEALTGRPAPAWLNRAASIGLALPCVVPREWIAPPDVDTADGELLGGEDEDEEEYEEEYAHERAGMLESDRRRRQREEERQLRRGSKGSYRDLRDRGEGSASSSSAEDEVVGQSLAGGRRLAPSDQPARIVNRKDSAGRDLPVAERAPIPKSTKT